MNLSAPIIALDGEGYTDARGRHLYTYVAACSAKKRVSALHRPKGITTTELLDWLLSLPKDAILVGFSLGYDFAKWVEGMHDGAIYSLTHPDLRQGEHGPRAVRWGAYRVNKVSRKFSVATETDNRVVWDVWAFFQTSFVKALEKWEIGTKKERAFIAKMKAQRANFRAIGPAQRRYCQSECMLLARLVRALLDAHVAAGLELTALYGPGSTAAVMLKAMGADAHNVQGSDAFRRAVSCAFVAGRFEESRTGPVRAPTWSYDLASAYPYAWCLLPCLKHGRWRRASARACERAMARGQLVLCHYRLDGDGDKAWGPLPHRMPKGELVFPQRGAGGWAWSPELLAGRKLHARIVVREGYILDVKCKCGFPFREYMVNWYKERLRWGKTGKGRVLRLGMNSCTGKAMQSVGSTRYRCLVRAGLVTAFTRARLLSAIASASAPSQVLETATDSVLACEPLRLDAPVELGTARAARAASKREGKRVQPLGAWDASDVNPDGVFLCRPGMRFGLSKDASEDETAARGMGVSTLHAARERILASWAAHPLATVLVPAARTFIGAKSGIRKARRGWTFTRDKKYGTWVQPPPRKLSFSPKPKRESVGAAIGSAYALQCYELPQGARFEGVPYEEAPVSEQTQHVRDYEDMQEEQG